MKMGKKTQTRKGHGPKSEVKIVQKKVPWSEITGLISIALGFFIMFCLVNPSIAGNMGQKTGVLLLQFMGWGSFSIPLLLIMTGVWFLHPFKSRVFLFYLILTSLCAWIVEISRCLIVPVGGAWAMIVKAVLVRNLGVAGSWIVLSASFIISVILLSGVRIKDVAAFLVRVLTALAAVSAGIVRIARGVAQRIYILFTPLAKRIAAARQKKAVVKRSEEEIVRDLREAAEIVENIHIARDLDPEAPVREKPPVPRKEPVKEAAEEKPLPPPAEAEFKEYSLPTLALLESLESGKGKKGSSRDYSSILVETLGSFGVSATVINIERGPSVTRYELQPAKGVRVNKISGLQNDLSLVLAAPIRIEAPVPGKACVGIEVPNERIDMVHVKEILQSEEFRSRELAIPIAIGKDITGKAVVGDLAKMPHLLVAGATGSGKSVCMNGIIASLLFTMYPTEVQLIMIDPKVVELSMYEGIPHLMDIKSTKDERIVTDAKIATLALHRLTEIMDERYHLFKALRARNIFEYNKKAPQQMPYIVIIIDELADLMMVSSAQVEKHICRIAQKGRAAGIHLIVATQRPSVNVITGIIKANIPSRIAFAVAQNVDSRTILDRNGAEKLLGKGDMLYHASGTAEPRRVQGAFISSEDIENIVAFWHEQPPPENLIAIDVEQREGATGEGDEEENEEGEDDLFSEAVRIILAERQASVSILQRKMKIGYARAGRIIDRMEKRGIVGPANGSKPRAILAGVAQDAQE